MNKLKEIIEKYNKGQDIYFVLYQKRKLYICLKPSTKFKRICEEKLMFDRKYKFVEILGTRSRCRGCRNYLNLICSQEDVIADCFLQQLVVARDRWEFLNKFV